jgi:hypothetical protein
MRTAAKASGQGNSATTAVSTGKTVAAASATRSGTKTTGGGSGTSSASGRTTSAAARAIAARSASQASQRRRPQQTVWWRQAISGQRGMWLSLGAVALVVVLFIVLATRNGQSNAGQPVPANVLHAVTNVSPSVSARVGTGGLSAPFKATPANTAPLTSGGKPELFYAGGEYCPFCAAERWSMIVALSRFGTFSNLHLITSSEGSIPTFTFYQSSYTSPYLVFTPKETLDQNQNPLESLNAQQQALLSTFDKAPYTNVDNSIPFLDIGGRYIQVGSGYDPSIIQSGTWSSIASALSNPTTPEAQNIVGNANYLTAALCKLTNNQPANACSAAPIPSIEQKLP